MQSFPAREFVCAVFLCLYVTYGEDKKSTLEVLAKNADHIKRCATAVGLSPRLVASVIFAERRENYRLNDALLDAWFARFGYNASIGFGQVKVNTAVWIEREVSIPRSSYYLNSTVAHLFLQKSSRSQLIEKLNNDSINCLYATTYLAMIWKRWSNAGLKWDENTAAGILSTLYSLGVFLANGAERLPHSAPKMNELGRVAQAFFSSSDLRQFFPQ
jgi:hypothetical protein